MTESVQESGAQLKKAIHGLMKKCKGLKNSMSKTTKDVDVLEDRVKRLMSKSPKKVKSKRKRLQPIKEEQAQVTNQMTNPVLQRPPTPMVSPQQVPPQQASVAGRSWWNVNDVTAPPFVGSDVTPRRVSPTPHFISPVYASRNFIR